MDLTREVEVLADHLGDLPERHALVSDSVPARPGRRRFQSQSVEVRLHRECAPPANEDRSGFSRRRQAFAASAELQEREHVKLASLALALADAWQRRGVAALPASLAAEAGIAVFKTAFGRWTGDAGERTLSDWIHECVRTSWRRRQPGERQRALAEIRVPVLRSTPFV
jgi:hypothetical protein